MNSRSPTVLVLGGGVGGLVAANRLARALDGRGGVVLIERESDHLFTPSLLWLMGGKRRPEQIRRPLSALRRRGVEVVRAEIESIDPRARSVVAGGKAFNADHIVIALGADLAPERVPGLVEAGHNLYTLPGMLSLQQALQRFDAGRIAVVIASVPFKCPAAPYEAAMLIHDFFRAQGRRDRVQIDLYAAEPGPMGVAGAEVSAAVRNMVTECGIAYHPEHVLTEVDPERRGLAFANGKRADCDLLAFVPPHQAPRVVRESGLCPEGGWVPVNRATLETAFPGVHAIGDVTGIPLKLGKPLPKAGTFAHAQAEVVAHNIACAVLGRGEPRQFDGVGECFIEMGQGRAGYAKGNFFAEPLPEVRMRTPGRRWHWSKVLFEKHWLWRWF